MAQHIIDELNTDLKELDNVLSQLKREKNIDRLTRVRKELSDEIAAAKKEVERLKIAKANKCDADTGATKKRFEFELTNYAFDQSDKFVKIFIALDNVQNTADENVVVDFTEKSIAVSVAGVDDKDYKFAVNNLLYKIDVGASYRKVKTNAIAIYAKKAEEKKQWSHLTSTEKRLADVKNSSYSEVSADTDKSDPTAGLMNIMKKMYDTGDPEMKKMIAKAWTEGQENKMKGMDSPF